MAKEKQLEVGDTVFHKTADERREGIVIATKLVEVDWGPELGTSVCLERALTDKYTPKFGDG